MQCSWGHLWHKTVPPPLGVSPYAKCTDGGGSRLPPQPSPLRSIKSAWEC